MGSAARALERSGISTLGRQRWQENQKKIESFWLELEKEVDDLGLDVEKLHIYQDGLPCAGSSRGANCAGDGSQRRQELSDCAKAHGQGR